jgi:hypothetical protein
VLLICPDAEGTSVDTVYLVDRGLAFDVKDVDTIEVEYELDRLSLPARVRGSTRAR